MDPAVVRGGGPVEGDGGGGASGEGLLGEAEVVEDVCDVCEEECLEFLAEG